MIAANKNGRMGRTMIVIANVASEQIILFFISYLLTFLLIGHQNVDSI